jgi:hypothetical protein
VSKATFVPSFFILAGSILFRIVSRYNNAVQIATFLLLFGLGLAAWAWRTTCCRCNWRWRCNRPARAWRFRH